MAHTTELPSASVAFDSNSPNSTDDGRQLSHIPNGVLELPYVLCHPSLGFSLRLTAQLLATTKAVGAAATAARSGQLQELHKSMSSSSEVQSFAAWLAKHAELLQGVHTLKLQLDRTAIESSSRTAGMWSALKSHFAGLFGHSTITATSAASILRSMPRNLSTVKLQLQDLSDVTTVPLHWRECSMIRAELAALPNLRSIRIAGPDAAACLPYGPNLAATFSQLTSVGIGTIKSQAAVTQLLQSLPASLQQLRMDVATAERLLNNVGDLDVLLELQYDVQLSHLTALTTLHVTGTRFVVGEDSNLPPNLINLTLLVAMHARPLLQLTRLQHLQTETPNLLELEQFEDIAGSLTQLTCLVLGEMLFEDEAAPQIISALAALPVKDLGVLSHRPQQPGAAAGVTGPAAVGALLGQLTGLTSLTLALGAYAWRDLAASLAHLTNLTLLILEVAAKQPGDDQYALLGDEADCESFMDALAGLPSLRVLQAFDTWFGCGYADGQPHPILRLQAAKQLTYLNIVWLQEHAGIQEADLAILVQSLPGVEFGNGVLAKLDGFPQGASQ